MDLETYRKEMKENIKKAHEKMEENHHKIEKDFTGVRRAHRIKYDALRDMLNEVDKKLERFYEIDFNLWIYLKKDIDELWKKITLILEI